MAKLNFNIPPYFDSFSEDKNFYQVLYQPRRTIQTQELNSMASILAGQTEQLADHLFKFGSSVRAGTVRLKNYQNYVRLRDLDSGGTAIDASRFKIGDTISGATSDLQATIIFIADANLVDPVTLYVNYLNTALDGTTTAFVDGEDIKLLDDMGFTTYTTMVRCPTCPSPDVDTVNPTGRGCLFAIDESSYYVFGKIVPTPFQMIVLDKYTTQPSYKVGFDVVQSVVTSQEDTTLLDNALGTPNFSAPGADRYKISLVLVNKPLNDENDENFVLLAKVQVGVLQEVNDKPQYAAIMDTISRRTFDESGNYTVNPFTINFKEHLSSGVGNNDGFLDVTQGGDETKFVTMVSPGKSYVRGREVELISERVIAVDKARDTEGRRSSVIRPTHGNYILVTLDSTTTTIPLGDVSGSATVNDFEVIGLFDGASSAGNSSGTQIGTARSKSIELHSGFVGGTGNDVAVYKLFIFDIQMGGNSIADVVGIHKSGGAQIFSANTVQVLGVTNVFEPTNNELLFPIPFPFVSTIRDVDNPLLSNTSTQTIKKFSGAVNAGGVVSFVSLGNESFLSFNSNRWIGGLQPSPGLNYDAFNLDLPGIISSSPNQIDVNVGVANAGKSFVLLAEVLTVGVIERTKIINTKFLNGIDGTQLTISGQEVDAFKLTSVIDVTTGNPGTYVDVTANYTLNPNVKDNYYDVSTLTLNTGVATPPPGTLLDIEYDYFQHGGTGNFFSVDSYTSIINDISNSFTYEDIPTYTTLGGTTYRLSDVIDARPSVDGSTGTFGSAGATLNDLPVTNSNIIFDVSYFLPRVDVLAVTEFGDFRVVKGTPATNPFPPPTPENSMVLYNISINPYTFDVKRDINTLYIDNRRYTMADIGKLNNRINNLEYYVTFNLLEKNTSDQVVTDANGNNRFKNGFITDNFKDYLASQTNSIEYRCALDTDRGELRPSFYQKNVGMLLNGTASSGFVTKSDVALLPYTELQYQDQPYSSKTVSVNPYFIFEAVGIMKLAPNMDIWKDVDTEPDLVVNIDTGVEALRDIADAAGVMGVQWNNWQTTNISSTSQSSSQSATRLTGSTRFWRGSVTEETTTTATTTTTNQARTGTNRSIQGQIENNSLGENVTSVNIIPFIRAIPVQFVATNMKPRTRVYAFFDGVDVTENCRLVNGDRAANLVTDAEGNIVGTFDIPNTPTKRFFTGTRTFRLTNHVTDGRNPDELLTSAEEQFYAGGIQETRRETVLSVRSPQVIEGEVRQARSNTTINTTVNTEITSVTRSWLVRRAGDDPLAQSFTIAEQSGVFISSIDVFFAEKHTTIPVWLQIRNMINGIPGSVILPYSEVVMRPANINISEAGNVATRFTFEAPVYLQSDEEFCFVIGSSSVDHRIHVSELGGIDKLTGVTISTQPHLGSMFKSQNDQTWTPEQKDDIKFSLNRANFDTNTTMNLVFNNKSVERTPLIQNPIETETGTNLVRIHHRNHGLNAPDKVKLELLADTWVTIHVLTGNLIVGQSIQGSSGATFTVSDLERTGINPGDGAAIYRVKMADLDGEFALGESYVGTLFYEPFRNPEMMATLGIIPSNVGNSVPTGTIPGGVANTYNGIPLTELSSGTLLIQAVDHIDSYVVQVTTNATATGRSGGTGNFGTGNIQVDVINMSAQYLDYTGSASWNLSGISHKNIGSTVTDYTAVANFPLLVNENTELTQPMKVANDTNEGLFLGVGNKSMTLTGQFTTEDSFVSPIFNLDSINFVAVANRIDFNDCDTYSVAPNAGTWVTLCTEPTSTARWTAEEDATSGTEAAKYIMSPVNLRNPATNIKIFLDILKFIGTDVDVYYRTLPTSIETSLITIDWTKAVLDGDVISSHPSDFKEAEVTIPANNIGALPEFKSFQIKLVLRSRNTSIIPKVRNIRALAVT